MDDIPEVIILSVCPYLPLSDVFNLQSTSKSIKQGVDVFLEKKKQKINAVNVKLESEMIEISFTFPNGEAFEIAKRLVPHATSIRKGKFRVNYCFLILSFAIDLANLDLIKNSFLNISSIDLLRLHNLEVDDKTMTALESILHFISCDEIEITIRNCENELSLDRFSNLLHRLKSQNLKYLSLTIREFFPLVDHLITKIVNTVNYIKIILELNNRDNLRKFSEVFSFALIKDLALSSCADVIVENSGSKVDLSAEQLDDIIHTITSSSNKRRLCFYVKETPNQLSPSISSSLGIYTTIKESGDAMFHVDGLQCDCPCTACILLQSTRIEF